ncbi:hypothetical protein [Paractinoplanes brasiliensis]|uniref:hypothetical protein n=1 Tax=Paractinoplanes brasiliensis TaxID=52695 RepID=UPI00105DB144|nr:hypothetical protein [Actinoplanes brasiliensis]GID25141.1 hypothetical protein Abr02nite_01240 [Actinoplanes brasiliensis]
MTAALLAAAGLALPAPAHATAGHDPLTTGTTARSPYAPPTDNAESGKKYQVHGATPPTLADPQRELAIATLSVDNLDEARRITTGSNAPDLILTRGAQAQDICHVAGIALTCGTIGDGKPDSLQELALVISRNGGPAYDVAADLRGAGALGTLSGFLFRAERLSLSTALLNVGADVANPQAFQPDVGGKSAPQIALFEVKATAGADEHYPLWAISATEQTGHAATLIDGIEAAHPYARVVLGGDATGTDGLNAVSAAALLVNDALHGDLIEARETVARFHAQAGLSVGDASATEGTPLVFPVTLTRPLSQALTVCAATVPGTTTLPNADYEPYRGCRTVPAGAIRADFPVQVRGDRLREGSEQLTFEVTALSAVRVVKSRGTGTITDQ